MIKIELTEAQLSWLEELLGRGMDGFFEYNKKARKHCDNIHEKIFIEMKRLGYFAEKKKRLGI